MLGYTDLLPTRLAGYIFFCFVLWPGEHARGRKDEDCRGVDLFLFYTFIRYFFLFLFFSFNRNHANHLRHPQAPGSRLCIHRRAAARFQEKKKKKRNETSGNGSKSFLNKTAPPSPFFWFSTLYSCVFGLKKKGGGGLKDLFTCWEI